MTDHIYKKHSYAKVFLLAFAVFAVILVPLLIYNKGYMTYYGDFNSQQLPFYRHAHEAVRKGNFLWDWGTDLGSDFITSYSFYLLGSPFFWLSTLFPTSAVLYLIPWLLALKYAFAALTSYAYIRRFVRKDESAFIGAFLYAFSGFQMYNIFFNHFHDVTAFFPLMLIAMEENITRKRRGVFALTVALMAIINYFFFTGQAVFLIIYFLLRSCCSDFKVTPKKFMLIFAEALLGVGIAAIILVPSAISIIDNYRVSEHLYGMDMLAYNDRTRIWRILQNSFMLPEVPARSNLLHSGSGKWSSIAAYLPMFSLIGVFSFLKSKPGKWSSKLIKICAVCAVIPILNSAFYMFNASYYARWFYMPVLIMALVTVQTLERNDISEKPGIKSCIWLFAVFLIISVLPSKKDDKVTWFSFAEDKIYFYLSVVVTLVFFVLATDLFKKKRQNADYMKRAVTLTVVACFVCTATVFYYGLSIGPYTHKYIETAIEGHEKINISSAEDEFFRVDISENYDNYPMLWGYSSMRCFQSVVSPSIMEFYDKIGITRDVASRADTSYYSLRGLFSVKYYFSHLESDKTESKKPELPGFKLISEQNGFNVYENQYYIPMGFTYDYYINEEKFNSLSEISRTNALLRAILLSDKQIEKYGHLLENADTWKSNNLTKEYYLSYCEERINSACYDFTKSSDGFTARINTPKPNLVFFSVPYDKGFTAYVNGQETTIEKVSNGFMAVEVPEGESTITFRYYTYGLRTGITITLVSLGIFAVFMIICTILHFINKKKDVILNSNLIEIEPSHDVSSLIINDESFVDIPTPENEYDFFR